MNTMEFAGTDRANEVSRRRTMSEIKKSLNTIDGHGDLSKQMLANEWNENYISNVFMNRVCNYQVADASIYHANRAGIPCKSFIDDSFERVKIYSDMFGHAFRVPQAFLGIFVHNAIDADNVIAALFEPCRRSRAVYAAAEPEDCGFHQVLSQLPQQAPHICASSRPYSFGSMLFFLR